MLDPNDNETPTLDDFTIEGNTTDGYVVSGTGEDPDDAVIVENAAGERISAGTIAEDGSVVINIHPSLATPGQVLFLAVTDEAGNVTGGIEIIVSGDGEAGTAGAVLAFFRRKLKN